MLTTTITPAMTGSRRAGSSASTGATVHKPDPTRADDGRFPTHERSLRTRPTRSPHHHDPHAHTRAAPWLPPGRRRCRRRARPPPTATAAAAAGRPRPPPLPPPPAGSCPAHRRAAGPARSLCCSMGWSAWMGGSPARPARLGQWWQACFGEQLASTLPGTTVEHSARISVSQPVSNTVLVHFPYARLIRPAGRPIHRAPLLTQACQASPHRLHGHAQLLRDLPVRRSPDNHAQQALIHHRIPSCLPAGS